jgi:hypothetical protein
MRILIAALAIVCVAAAQAAAGPDLGSLKKGDRVRIKGVGQEGVFIVEELQPDALMLRDPDGIMPQKVRLSALSSLEVGIPRSDGEGAGHGAVLGAMVGLATGILAGFAMGDDPGYGDESNGEMSLALSGEGKALILGVVLCAGGAVIGAVAGSIRPGERWESIPLDARLDAGMARDGTARAGITFSIRGL